MTAGPGRWVVRLDVKDYFDSISVARLLALVLQRVKPAVVMEQKFDDSTISQIEFFFKFLMYGKDGIPQAENNVASSYLGYLFLFFGDQLVVEAVNEINRKYENAVRNFQIVRYADDTYIFLDMETNEQGFQIEVDNLKEKRESPSGRIIYDLLLLIADKFYSRLGLRINEKTKIDAVLNEEVAVSILTRLNDSFEDLDLDLPPSQVESDVKADGPDERLEELKSALQLVKGSALALLINNNYEEARVTLNYVFDKRISQMINKCDFKNWLETYLEDLDFRKCAINPKVFMILISTSAKSALRFEQFIKDDKCSTAYSRHLAVSYLCQTGFKSRQIINSVKTDKHLSLVMNVFVKSKIESKMTIYEGVALQRLGRLLQMPLVEQWRLRAYHEKVKDYSPCLNFLLNEIHYICSVLDKKNIHDYDALGVKKFMAQKGVEQKTQDTVRNLFDRRNHNPFSHPGDNSRFSSSVSEAEYFHFKKGVEDALAVLVRKN